jgi:hypothetical protein
MPTSDPFSRSRGDELETYDERKWICEGTGVYELVYVDGSLPWIATVGDQIQYAEFSEKSGSLQQYEAQRIKNEVEYGTGWAVPLDKVREATGKPDLHEGETATLQPTAAKKKKVFKTVFMFAIAAIIVNLALALFCITRGDLVMRQFFSPRELNGETISKPFTVREKNEIIKIEAVAPQLSNAWMYLNWAIVRNEDRVLHVSETNISYYQGYSGGEHWTEGSQSRSEYIKIPEPGTYQLLVHGVSNRGNTNTAQTARHGVQLSVYTGAMLSRYFFIAMVFSIFSLFFLVIIYSAWKGGDEDED